MLLLKCSLLAISLFAPLAQSYTIYSDNQCLNEGFEIDLKHSYLPFDLLAETLIIRKELCIVEVEHTKWGLLSSSWYFDVCRSPVHLKKEGAEGKVLRRQECQARDMKGEIPEKSAFCRERDRLFGLLENMALVYAQGEKENLGSEHGRAFCVYALAQEYLAKGQVLNRHQQYQDIVFPGLPKRPGDDNARPTEDRPAPTPAAPRSAPKQQKDDDLYPPEGPMVREI